MFITLPIPGALVGQVGLEPTMVKPADLQSAAIAARRLTHMVEPAGVEPATPRFSVWRSTNRATVPCGVDDGNRTRDRRNHNPLPYHLATSTMIGADRGIRTPDPRLKRALLYQLSYVRVYFRLLLILSLKQV